MPAATPMRSRRADEHTPPAAQGDVGALRRAAAGLAAWLVPGAGHWMLGFRVRAVVIAVGLLGLFWFGETALGGNIAVSRDVSPIFYVCQIGNGLSTLAADAVWGEPLYGIGEMSPDRRMPPHYHLGILFTTISGLLNLLAVLHVLDPRTAWAAPTGAAASAGHRGDASGPSAAARRGPPAEGSAT